MSFVWWQEVSVERSDWVIFTGHDCSIRLWNMESKTCIQEFTAHRKKFEESIHDVAFHPTKCYIGSAGADALAKVFVWPGARRMSGDGGEGMETDDVTSDHLDFSFRTPQNSTHLDSGWPKSQNQHTLKEWMKQGTALKRGQTGIWSFSI